MERHVELHKTLESVDHPDSQRGDLAGNHRDLVDRAIDLGDPRTLVIDLPLQTGVVDLEAIDLLGHRFIVGEQVPGFVRQAIYLRLGLTGRLALVFSNSEDGVEGVGMHRGCCTREGTRSCEGSDQDIFQSMHSHGNRISYNPTKRFKRRKSGSILCLGLSIYSQESGVGKPRQRL